MNRKNRDIIRAVRDAGGHRIEIGPGGKHSRIIFMNPAGERHEITFHASSNGKAYEDAFRSQLRRRGLNP
jgi:hypothetical protein